MTILKKTGWVIASFWKCHFGNSFEAKNVTLFVINKVCHEWYILFWNLSNLFRRYRSAKRSLISPLTVSNFPTAPVLGIDPFKLFRPVSYQFKNKSIGYENWKSIRIRKENKVNTEYRTQIEEYQIQPIICTRFFIRKWSFTYTGVHFSHSCS